MIRPYQDSDLPALREITVICFEGTSVDQNIDRKFGPMGDLAWGERKARTVDADAEANPEGIFVAEVGDRVVGYISSRVDPQSRIGWIPNMGVLPEFQNQGLGRSLFKAALDYMEQAGMELVRIETLEQNPVGPTFYPGIGFQEIARQIHYALPLKDRRI